MKLKCLPIVISCFFSLSVSANYDYSNSSTIMDMTEILKSAHSYKVGDIDGDGFDEIVYQDKQNNIKAIKVSPALNESTFNVLANTRWVLSDHQYGSDYILGFNLYGNTVSLNTGMRTLDLSVSPQNTISGFSSVGSIIIEGITPTMIWGKLSDPGIDGQNAELTPFKAFIKK